MLHRRYPVGGESSRAWLLLVAVLLLGAFIYSYRAFQFFGDDDEGGYVYAAWRVSEGEVPYRDFLTPQMPVFLYVGGAVVRLFGRSFIPLRLATMSAALLSALFLYLLNAKVYGRAVALLSASLFLLQANVLQVGRVFRPEAYMVLFELAGLYVFVLGESRKRTWLFGLAGILFGLAILTKLFGVLPLLGCYLFLLYAWLRERRPFKEVLREGLALGLPALVLVTIVAGILAMMTPYFFTAVFEHHMMQGTQLSALQTISKGLRFYWGNIVSQPVVLVLALWGGIAVFWPRRPVPPVLWSLLLWQLPTALAFLVISRSLHARYLSYLAPAITTLAAVASLPLLRGEWRLWRVAATDPIYGRGRRWAGMVVVLGLGLLVVYPWAVISREVYTKTDGGFPPLATVIQAMSTPDELVISDYPGINFLINRRSTYWAAGLSGGGTSSGQILGQALIEELKHRNVAMVLIDTGFWSHQLTAMRDYGEFQHYVHTHYYLISKMQWNNEVMEIYARQDTITHRLKADFRGELVLTGVQMNQAEVADGASFSIAMRWQALAQMSKGYNVALFLLGADGQRWGQVDDQLLERRLKQTHNNKRWEPGLVVWQDHTLTIPAATPPGSYVLAARVYERDGTETLTPKLAQGDPLPTGEILIAPVRVLPAAP